MNFYPLKVFMFKFAEFIIAAIITSLFNIQLYTSEDGLYFEGPSYVYTITTLIILICFVFLDPLTRKQNIIFCVFGVICYAHASIFLTFWYESAFISEKRDMLLLSIILSVLNAILMLVEAILACVHKFDYDSD